MAPPQYTLGLFNNYVIDTSSLVDLCLEQKSTKIMDALCVLIEQGSVKTVSAVMPELERMVGEKKFPLAYLTKLKERRPRFVLRDVDLIIKAGRIMHKYPKLGKAFDMRNCADPWIVAAGTQKGLIVITEERA